LLRTAKTGRVTRRENGEGDWHRPILPMRTEPG
jgi:hypothetical protein